RPEVILLPHRLSLVRKSDSYAVQDALISRIVLLRLKAGPAVWPANAIKDAQPLRRVGLAGRIRRPQVPGRADRVRGDALHVAVQASFVTTVDWNRQDGDRTVLGVTGLGRHRPAPVPQASGQVRGLSGDGDADHSGGELFAGHQPEQD